MFIIEHRKFFYILSGLFVGVAIVALFFLGVKPSIEFTGGSLLEVRYEGVRPEKAALESELAKLPLGSFSLRPTGEEGYIFRTRDLSDEEAEALLGTFRQDATNPALIERQSSIGPTLGSELRSKAFIAIILVVLAIVLYIAYIFRKVSKPVSSWKYGVIAIIALLHDVIVPTGVFAVLGALLGVEVDVLFVIALLTILGYSVNDTIVVFDRVRERLRHNESSGQKESFEKTVGKSLDQTIERSINTSVTVFFVLLALFFFGAQATASFALALLVGVVAGTYSSVCLAAPLLVTAERLEKKATAA